MSILDFIRRFFGLEKETGCIEVRVKKAEENIAYIFKILQHRKEPHLIFTTIIHNFKIKILAMQLDQKQFVDTILGLEDSDTKQPIAATFDGLVLTSSDPTIFTADADVNADGKVDVVGVGEGTATLNVKANATYTDSNTGQQVTAAKEANIDVTVSKPLPGAENTDLVVTFSDPQAVPTPAPAPGA